MGLLRRRSAKPSWTASRRARRCSTRRRLVRLPLLPHPQPASSPSSCAAPSHPAGPTPTSSCFRLRFRTASSGPPPRSSPSAPWSTARATRPAPSRWKTATTAACCAAWRVSPSRAAFCPWTPPSRCRPRAWSTRVPSRAPSFSPSAVASSSLSHSQSPYSRRPKSSCFRAARPSRTSPSSKPDGPSPSPSPSTPPRACVCS